MKNEWFERGELPPVGFTQNECKLVGLCYERFAEFEIVAHVKGKAIVVVTKYNCGSTGVWASAVDGRFFKPICTEREKAIEAAINIIKKSKEWTFKEITAELYDAGLLRLPEDK